LELEEGGLGGGFGLEISTDGDVYYAAGGDVGREQN
jgi:hypothetical protein